MTGQPASLSSPTFPHSLLPPSTALVPFDDFPMWRSRWPLDAPERNFLLTISLPPGLGKELVDVMMPPRAGPGRNTKMDNFHFGGQKCSYFSSWLQAFCDSGSRVFHQPPKDVAEADTHLRTRTSRLLSKGEGLKALQAEGHDAGQIS